MKPVPHPRIPSLLWTGEIWVLRDKGKINPDRCLAHQCRHIRPIDGSKYCAKCRKRLSRMNNPISSRYTMIKQRCQRSRADHLKITGEILRKHDFTISTQDFFQVFYDSPWFEEILIQPFLPFSERVTVDRIDHVYGYEEGNVQLLRGTENFIKGVAEQHGDPF